jgi:hypothetical protein
VGTLKVIFAARLQGQNGLADAHFFSFIPGARYKNRMTKIVSVNIRDDGAKNVCYVYSVLETLLATSLTKPFFEIFIKE